MMNELDRVVLQTDLPDLRLTVGNVGTVVMVHQGGHDYTVEFLTLAGETVAVVPLRTEQIRSIRLNDMTLGHQFPSA